MMWRGLCGVLFFPMLLSATVLHDLNIGLQSLQQVRTLIPERFFEEEFAIIVDQKAFAKACDALASNAFQEPHMRVVRWLASSQLYYSHWTLSGEPVRILDSYQEFEYGPYWLYPTAMRQLQEMYPK
ncbi:MAG: hypothetical protein HY861_03405 [Chlamydiia bacterium]|nr:hypothetical protein [Chlamydiia bacterium]